MAIRRLLIPIVLLILPIAGGAFGQASLGGEVGTDLDMHDFYNILIDDGRDYLVERSLSRQFLGLNYLGPIVSRNFADLTLKTRLNGTYLKTINTNEGITDTHTDYINPALDHLLSSFSLFPLRTYNLRYTFGKTKTYTNRYEPARRTDTQLQQPNLGVVRRYESDLLSHSVQGQAALAEKVSFSVEGRREHNELTRQYDFQENLDIWVVITPTTEDPSSPTHPVIIVNRLDDVVLIYIDLIFADSLSAGEVVTLTLDKGVHEVDFVPTRFNAYNTSVNVQSLMRWQILYNAPKGSADQDQYNNNAESVLRIGGREQRFQNETRYQYTDLEERVQDLSTTFSSLNNLFDYNVRPGLDIQMVTNATQTTTDIPDVSSEKNSSFLNQTQARIQKWGGPSFSLGHSYNLMRAISSVDLKSRTHIINGQGFIPTMIKGHTIDLRTTTTLVADNKDYVNNQFMAGIANKFDRRRGGFRLRPQHEIKYITSNVDNPNAGTSTSSSEIDNQIRFDGERSRLPALGNLRMKAEWEWRSRESVATTEVMNRYLAELAINKQFSRKLQVTASVNTENQFFNLEIKDRDFFGDNPPSPRPDQNRVVYRLDMQSQPREKLNFGANGMVIHQNGSKISRVGMSLSGRLPGIDVPIRSFLTSESRELAGLDPQSLLQAEAQLSHRYRQITFVLIYAFIKEKRIAEDYRYSQIYIRISRLFDIF